MVRQQINKWQRTHSSLKIRGLKETEDFDLKISLSKDSSNLCVSIFCKKCGNNTALGSKDNTILLSNWTRHITKCIEKREISTPKVSKIDDFFQSKASLNNLPLKSSVSSSESETSTEAIPDDTPSFNQESKQQSLSESPVAKEASLDRSPIQSSATQEQSHDKQVFRIPPPAQI